MCVFNDFLSWYFYHIYLNRNGLLAVQTMHLVDDRGYDGSMERYLEAELGLSANLFPTFLGLHLAEDFELGTRYHVFVSCGCVLVPAVRKIKTP